ncbi:MAG: hypothetical protein QOI63_1951 [Thermoplasmata archaeon]|jgi:hypothetical protein|nr:hypothetical protein [Thermoplasmata archaeon]
MAPQGSKSAYTSKQKRQAHHIETSVKARGGSSKKTARIAYATVNKQDGGGKKSGSGRHATRSTRKGARTAGRASRSSRTTRTSRKARK